MIKPKKSIEEMKGYFVPMYEDDWEVKIDSNENNYGPSPKVIQSLKNCDFKSVSFYPFYGELTQKISDYICVNFNNIKVTNGADEAIQSIIQTYLDKDEALLTLDISFDMPVIYTQIQGGKIIKVPFKEKWKFPVSSFLKELQNPAVKIVYIATPNNPTGNIIEENELVQILEKAQDKVVIIDETYANYAGITYTKYIKDFDNIFIVRSFSKDFALAGLRLGFIISAEENTINLKKTVSPFSVNKFAMKAGIAALSDIEYFENIKAEIYQTKSELKTFLQELGAVVYNSSANFLLADFKNKADFVYNKLKKSNVTVKLFKKESPLKNHLRITIPTKEGFKKIKEALKIKPSLVFDMDGVLIDARNSYRTAIEKTYKLFTNKTINEGEIQALKNKGGMNNDWDLTKFLIEKQGVNVTYEEVVNSFQKIYWDEGRGIINNEKALFSKELLEELSKYYNISIYTGRPKKEAAFAIKKFNAENLFYPVITSDDIPSDKGKPNPFGLNLMKDLTISDKYYYFGDTPDDITAAKAAGYIAIGVLPPQDKTKELSDIMKSKGAVGVINSINDIKTIPEIKDEAMC